MSTRREAREVTMQALYAFELGGGDAEQVLESLVQPRLEGDDEAAEFAKKLFLRAIDNSAETDALIAQHAENWEFSRIALVDRLVLRLAICEFISFADIPPKVTINEAIEVAKRFSTDRSGQFINGILDAVLDNLRESDRLKKSGRGLVGMQADAPSSESSD